MTKYQIFIRTTLLASALVLAGCPSIPVEPEGPKVVVNVNSPEWLQHQQQVQELTQYQARGNFGYISPQQNVAARFFWQQKSAENYRLLLTTPFGGKVVEMNVQPGLVQLTDNKDQIFVGNSPEELIVRLTGMQIPLSSLRQWLVGLPGESSQFALDSEYRLKQLTLVVDGLEWQVNYTSYHKNITPAMPREMELRQGDRRIKLKIDKWTFE